MLRAIAAVLAIEWLYRGRLSHRQNGSSILLSRRDSFFGDRKPDKSRRARPTTRKKFRALMELQILSCEPSCASSGERYDLLEEWYDHHASLWMSRVAPSICRLKTQLLSPLISLSSD